MFNKDTFPRAKRFNKGYLQVSAGNPKHSVYYEEYGKKKGDPVIFIHGGPGGGTSKDDTVFFDPKHYRIILFDQRGSGKSKPAHCLIENTTQHSIADINKLCDHLRIKGKFHLFGGSWGSTLSLAYAIAHPENVKSLTLRGIFLCRKQDIDILYQGNAAHQSEPQTCLAAIAFPNAWKQYVEFIPKEERGNMLAAYYRRLNSADTELQLKAAKIWSVWEGSTSKLDPENDFIKGFEKPKFALAFARIESHYFSNLGFLGDTNSGNQDYIRENISTIADAGIPTEIVQGRYDVVCPRYQADELARAWEQSSGNGPPLHIVTAGHYARDPETLKALIGVTQRMKHVV
jgi:proline iminopeptidase